MNKYKKSIDQWNTIYSKESGEFPRNKESGNDRFDTGLQWLTKETEVVLDFGCGNGSVLFLCSYYGTKKLIGIDLSEVAIKNAEIRSLYDSKSKYEFMCGGVELLTDIISSSVDAVILSNIIDNLYTADVELVIDEVSRILKNDGKVLIKLNPFLTDDQIEEYNIKVLDKNLLDDGMILLNNTSRKWDKIFESQFRIEHYEEIYYPEYDQYNRMYWLRKIKAYVEKYERKIKRW